jgi:hypothetical protein
MTQKESSAKQFDDARREGRNRSDDRRARDQRRGDRLAFELRSVGSQFRGFLEQLLDFRLVAVDPADLLFQCQWNGCRARRS